MTKTQARLEEFLEKVNWETFSGSVYYVINTSKNYTDGVRKLNKVFSALDDEGVKQSKNKLSKKGKELAEKVLREKFFKINTRIIK